MAFLFVIVFVTWTPYSGWASGTLVGQAYFDRIAGNPDMGRKTLYEWDLFLSPPCGSSYVGPSRRLGAPPGQPPTHDGYYRIDDLPAGTYSVYLRSLCREVRTVSAAILA